MSTILKALKKAQDDRELFVGPKVDVFALPERPRRKLWPWLLGGLLAANAVLVAAFFWLYPVSQSGPSIAERADPGTTVRPQVAEPAEQAPSSGEAVTIETPTPPAAQTALAAAQPSAEPESPEDISMPAEPLPETVAMQDSDGETTVTSEPPVTAALPSEPASSTRMDSSLMIDEETELAAEKIRTAQPASIGSEPYSAPDISALAVAPNLVEPTSDFSDVPTPRAKPLELLAALAPPKLAEAPDSPSTGEPLPSIEDSVQVAALPEHAVPEPGTEAVAEPPLEDELARFATVPVLRQMPREFRRSVPDLDISVHVYDGDPQWRFVRINKQKFREGDQVAKDLTLEAITPGGLVLVYQGSAFQLAKP